MIKLFWFVFGLRKFYWEELKEEYRAGFLEGQREFEFARARDAQVIADYERVVKAQREKIQELSKQIQSITGIYEHYKSLEAAE
jgi:hypothetical protein